MHNQKKLLFFVIFNFALVTAHCQKVRQIYGSSAGHADLILPQATIELDVPIVTSTYTAGKKSKGYIDETDPSQIGFYQSEYGVNPTILEKLKNARPDPTSGDITVNVHKVFEDSLKLLIIPRPDYSKKFAFSKLKKWNKAQGLTLNYNDDGITTDGDYSFENKTFDLIVKGLGAVASIVGKFLGRGGAEKAVKSPASLKRIPELDDVLNEFIALYNPSGSVMTYDIFKEMKTKLEKKYDEIFSKYFYSSEKSLRMIQVFYTPPIAPSPTSSPRSITTNICRLDNITGLLMLNPAIRSNIEVLGKQWDYDARAVGPYYNIELEARPLSVQVIDKTDARPLRSSFIPCNICVRAIVTLKKPNNTTLYQSFAKIPQSGKIGYINIKRPNKIAWQYDTWGELKKISTTTNAITTDQIGNLQSLTEQVKNIAKPDELSDLTKKVDLMKKKKEYEDLLKEQLEE
jgi:hypothetical protein